MRVLIKNKQTTEQPIVIDWFSSVGLNLKHFKATRVEEVRRLMPSEKSSYL